MVHWHGMVRKRFYQISASDSQAVCFSRACTPYLRCTCSCFPDGSAFPSLFSTLTIDAAAMVSIHEANIDIRGAFSRLRASTKVIAHEHIF